MNPLWLPALAELAVREELDAFGFQTQQYHGQRGRLLFYPAPKWLEMRHCTRWYAWEKRALNDHHPMCPTGEVFFFGDRWGVAFERWWRMADLMKVERGVWVGTSRSLTRALAALVKAMTAEVSRGVERFKAFEVETMLGGSPSLRGESGERHKTVRHYLESLGVHGYDRLFEPVEIGDHHGRQDVEGQGQGLGAGGRGRVPSAVRRRREARVAGARGA